MWPPAQTSAWTVSRVLWQLTADLERPEMTTGFTTCNYLWFYDVRLYTDLCGVTSSHWHLLVVGGVAKRARGCNCSTRITCFLPVDSAAGTWLTVLKKSYIIRGTQWRRALIRKTSKRALDCSETMYVLWSTRTTRWYLSRQQRSLQLDLC